MLSCENYNIKTWIEKFTDYKVDIRQFNYDKSWNKILEQPLENNYKEINRFLSYCLETTNGKIKIYPYPDIVFNAFIKTKFSDLKVVILGQDPYHKNQLFNDKIIPQAMGLSFSVPIGINIPSSL